MIFIPVKTAQDLKVAEFLMDDHGHRIFELRSINAPRIVLESNSCPRDQVIIDMDSIAQG
jgi:hypothetical protein